ncbi:hypothetical protein [Shimia thalassica]|uniref:hypothetical protein n=1 Tax=Shimia thalassica TaxID=1715693 RepID=UPI0026E48192|nr:hypothetical protein [Shimia thalassica]MDO6796840.1 hypothetical protein [Shimia thalassica]
MEEKTTGPKMFSVAWFRALLTAQLPTGETFWVGNFGTALFHQPLIAISLVLSTPVSVLAGLWGLLAAYQLYLATAVARSKPGVPTPVGWKIAGILVTLGNGALFFSFARAILNSAG